jgi:chromate transporter
VPVPVFLHILAIGALTFGGGYAMISALQQDLVARHGWLSPAEFSNGVAAGQVTPGPLMLMVAFLGYKLAGIWGALAATVALFAPSFLAVLLLGRSLDRLVLSPRLAAALKGVNAAVAGLLAAAALDMGRRSLTDPVLWALAAVSLAALGLSRRQDPTWIILGAGVAGALLLG